MKNKMEKNNKLLDCEQEYYSRLRLIYSENSMLFKFYYWLFKKNKE